MCLAIIRLAAVLIDSAGSMLATSRDIHMPTIIG